MAISPEQRIDRIDERLARLEDTLNANLRRITCIEDCVNDMRMKSQPSSVSECKHEWDYRYTKCVKCETPYPPTSQGLSETAVKECRDIHAVNCICGHTLEWKGKYEVQCLNCGLLWSSSRVYGDGCTPSPSQDKTDGKCEHEWYVKDYKTCWCKKCGTKNDHYAEGKPETPEEQEYTWQEVINDHKRYREMLKTDGENPKFNCIVCPECGLIGNWCEDETKITLSRSKFDRVMFALKEYKRVSGTTGMRELLTSIEALTNNSKR